MFRAAVSWLALALVIGIITFSSLATADDPQPRKAPEKPDHPKPATVKVEKGPLTAAVTLKGLTEPKQAAELSVRLKAWSGPLLVARAVAHGTAVKAGDVLIEFDTDKIDQALRDARQERDLAELNIRQAEEELPVLERQLPIDLAAAERGEAHAREDLKRFTDIEKPFTLLAADFEIRVVNYYLDDAKEELKQLQKMYRNKDLTEETEEIILKRYRQRVEQAEFYVKQIKLLVEKSLKVDLPRREQTVEENAAKAALALEKSRTIQPLTIRQKKLALAKVRYDNDRAKERLRELEQDRAALTIKAAADGLAYYGRYVRGQWMISAGSQGPKILRGGPVESGEVLLTLVSPQAQTVRAEVEEKDMAGLKPGLTGNLTPTAAPDNKVPARLTTLAPAPLNGKYEVHFEAVGGAGGKLLPGMACSIRVITARKDKALSVPASAVFREEGDDEERYVYRPVGSGKPEKRKVKVGLTYGDHLEILDGLAEGDEILAAKP